jgi:hypothetical protein
LDSVCWNSIVFWLQSGQLWTMCEKFFVHWEIMVKFATIILKVNWLVLNILFLCSLYVKVSWQAVDSWLQENSEDYYQQYWDVIWLSFCTMHDSRIFRTATIMPFGPVIFYWPKKFFFGPACHWNNIYKIEFFLMYV